MFEVTTINLTPDARGATSELGSSSKGSLDSAQLVELLQTFQQVDPVQNQHADPRIVVESSTGKFTIRTGQGKLYLYNTRDSGEPAVELDAAGILGALARPPTPVEASALDNAAPPAKTPHRAIAMGILASGLLLNAYTVYSVLNAERVNRTPTFTLITEPRERLAIVQSATGRYVTGDEPGDRAIEVTAEGQVRFIKIALHGERLDIADTYQLGRQGSKLVLATAENGVIEISNIDTVTYYRDPYHRTVTPTGHRVSR
jgi:hypothetical protein